MKVKGSRFLGAVFAAGDDAAVAAALDEVRRRHHGATHHCWAARVGPPGAPVERSEDDGEPSGTAGAPLLAALRHEDLHEALVVVTRYFGGTKLGTGGLARAYAEAARAALAAAPRCTLTLTATLDVRCGFDDLGIVEAVLARSGADIEQVERSFDPEPALRLEVLASRAERLAGALTEATAGRARIAPPSS